jgi:hypothetical protein
MKISHPMGTRESKSLNRNFKGSSTSSHKVEGFDKVLYLEYGKTLLRLKNLKATNGSALYVYLFTDRDASDFVNSVIVPFRSSLAVSNFELDMKLK